MEKKNHLLPKFFAHKPVFNCVQKFSACVHLVLTTSQESGPWFKHNKCGAHLFTWCVLPSGVMCVRSLLQIWQKKRPPSIKSPVWARPASLSSSSCNCRARTSSLSSGRPLELKGSGLPENRTEQSRRKC